MATPYLLFLLVIQCIIRSHMRTWRFWLKPLIMKNSYVNIYGELKVIALLVGLQKLFKKYCCFVCEWDSRTRSLHYSRKDWPARKFLVPGINNVQIEPLMEYSKILLPSTHLKLGLMKNFVKAKNQEEFPFTYEKVSQTKRGKIERSYFNWSTNTRPYRVRMLQ